jgi:uncharacterized protein YegP (UPF0339 family)
MPAMKQLKITVYQSKDGYRWRAQAANGKIVADGAEGYTRRASAFRAAAKVLDAIRTAGYLLVDERLQ